VLGEVPQPAGMVRGSEEWEAFLWGMDRILDGVQTLIDRN
jgi:hypothetical protein